MKEFDFDELDKAVNSLMGDVKQPSAQPDQSHTPPPNPAVVAPVSTTEPASAPLPQSSLVEEPAPAFQASTPIADEHSTPLPVSMPTPSATPVQKTGGRFMDVVHPSSDMKPATPIVVPSRQGINLQPLTSVNTATSPKVMNDIIAPPAKSPTPQLDMDQTQPAEPEEVPQVETEPSSNTSVAEPWSSPFLPDAQVEKRPLGGTPGPADTGLSDAIAAELAKEHPDIGTVPSVQVEPAVETPAQPANPEPMPLAPEPAPDTSADTSSNATSTKELQLAPEFDEKIVPAELHNDLVAIESGNVSLSPEPSEPTVPSSTNTTAVLSTSSIPQQYSETPSSGDVTHTPIYDNEAVHHPLNHPAKKKKGWVLVLFIVIVIALGGALGGAAYYFGLI